MPPRLEQERQVPPSEPVSLDRTLGRRDRDLEHLPTADHSHGCGLAARGGSERHLQRLAILDGAAADGQHNVAEQKPGAVRGGAWLEPEQHQPALLLESEPLAEPFLQLDRLRADTEIPTLERAAADDALHEPVDDADRNCDGVPAGKLRAQQADSPALNVR